MGKKPISESLYLTGWKTIYMTT